MEEPLSYMKEYVEVLRAALWDGNVDYRGNFVTAKARLNTAPRIPILISALGRGAFRLAGEISDGAISWNCPLEYLRDVALPALLEGASAARRTAPPIVAHAWVALGMDRNEAREIARKMLPGYARQPFYANMWAAAGFPVQPEQPDGGVSDALIDSLVVSGDEQEVAARLDSYLDGGLDELMLTSLFPDDDTDARTRLLKFIGGI
jgi:alkanesulfonate monooxygenase SsuD/methylene tetrahydromethanopterin reductase-like flavin-dependent oxidoreductase (luciferase family)